MVRAFLRLVVRPFPVFAILFVLSCASASAQNPFLNPPTYGGNGQMFTADLNGDGKPDLVFADGTVLLGKGDGTFTTGTSWNATGNSNASLQAVADFNGDGKQDLLLSGPLNQFSVLLGNGDGTFQAAVTTSIASPPSAVMVGDLNGDGKADILAQVGSNFSTFLSKGDGTFAAAIASNATEVFFFDAFGDFNGDGKLDLLTSQGVQLGNGDGTFQTVLPFPSGALSGTVVGDFDGDGRLDVFASGGTSGSPQIQVLFGNGDGTFHAGPVQSLPGETAIDNFASVDLNGDGKADVVGAGVDFVEVLIGKGDGTFVAGTLYNAPQGDIPTGATNFVIADFNGDNKKDVAAFNTMLLGNGDGTLQGNEAVVGLTGSGVTGDFNGDGHPDLEFFKVTGQASATVTVWLNDGKANFTLAHTYQLTVPANGNFGAFANITAAVDVNGDGKLDLVGYFAGADVWSAFVMLGNGDGSFGSPVVSPSGSGAAPDPVFPGFAVADLNGDGKPDLLISADAIAGATSFNVMLGNGDGTFAAPTNPFVGSSYSIVTGDFNNDHKTDVIVGGKNGIAVLLGNGDGTFQPTTFITSSACGTSCTNPMVADFNGDGNLDIFINAPGGYQVLLGKGDGTFTPLTAVGSSFGAIAQIADFNGDGKLDVLGNFPTSLMLGNGDGTFGVPFTYSSVAGTSLVADFNGDNRLDVAVFTTDQLVWLFNNGSGGTVTPPPPPPAPPDFSVGSGSGGGTATVTAGSTASYPLSLGGSGGFSGTVALTCSVAPAGPACSVSPASVMVSGSTPSTATVSVTTTARSWVLPIGGSNDRDPSRRILWIFSALMAAAVIRLFAGAHVRSRRNSWSLATACGAILLFSMAMLGGCGGGSTSPGGGGSTGEGGTASGKYTVTVTAQSGSVSHKTQLTLTVQ